MNKEPLDLLIEARDDVKNAGYAPEYFGEMLGYYLEYFDKSGRTLRRLLTSGLTSLEIRGSLERLLPLYENAQEGVHEIQDFFCLEQFGEMEKPLQALREFSVPFDRICEVLSGSTKEEVCIRCGARNPAQTWTCGLCGFVFPESSNHALSSSLLGSG